MSAPYKLVFSFVSSFNKQFLFEKDSAHISTLLFHVPFWPRKYKKYMLFIISNIANKSWKLSNCEAPGQAKNLER